MIFWRGKGFLTLLALVAGMAGSTFFYELFELDSSARVLMIGGSGALVAGLINFGLTRWLDRPVDVFDPDSGVHTQRFAGHSLYFVPMPYWTVILLIAGATALAGGLFRLLT